MLLDRQKSDENYDINKKRKLSQTSKVSYILISCCFSFFSFKFFCTKSFYIQKNTLVTLYK